MNTMTSLELSKKLYEGGCKIKSEYYQFELKDGQTFIDKLDKKRLEWLRMYHKGKWKSYPAYDLLWDVCVKYADKFFDKGLFQTVNIITYIIKLMYYGNKDGAESYIWANCLFNKEK